MFNGEQVELKRGYVITFEQVGEYRNIKKIEPVINKFQEKALAETANRNDYVRNMGISTSYAIELCKADKIKLDEVFTWSEKINDFIQNFADKEMDKLNKEGGK